MVQSNDTRTPGAVAYAARSSESISELAEHSLKQSSLSMSAATPPFPTKSLSPLSASTVGNTNPEPKFRMTADGSTRVEWATWPRAESFPPEVSPKRAAYLYALVTFVQAELEKLGIRAYAEGGSMLGQARDGGIIRYDDDIDMQIHYEDKHRFLAAITLLTERVRAWGRAIGEAADLIWTPFGYMAVLIPKDPELQVLRRPGSLPYYLPIDVEVDLFLTDLEISADGEARVTYSDPRFRQRMRARGDGDISASRLGVLPLRPFGPTHIRMPQDGRGACTDVFGPTCFDQVVCKDGRCASRGRDSLAVPMDAKSLSFYEHLIALSREA